MYILYNLFCINNLLLWIITLFSDHNLLSSSNPFRSEYQVIDIVALGHCTNVSILVLILVIHIPNICRSRI